MANNEIRNSITSNLLKYWQVADKVGISASQFSVWLRTELNEDRKQRVITAIEQLIEEGSK